MKKILLLTTLILAALALFSCTRSTPPDVSDGAPYSVIIRDDDPNIDLSGVIKAISNKSGRMMIIYSDGAQKRDGEIVFGDTVRGVSNEAKKELNLRMRTADGNTGYLIYKNDTGDVGVVWAEECACAVATEYFAENLADLDALAAMPGGVLKFYSFDKDKYLEDKKWQAVAAKASPELLSAFKGLNTFFNGPAIADWIAGLWSPYICVCGNCRAERREIACYGGGFYYANSSRDNDEFLPDVESTAQAISWLVNNGAFDNYPGYTEALPDGAKARIIAFVQALQSEEDGYFYHPQWGTDISTERRGRDISWSVDLLRNLGARPLYPTATDRLLGASNTSVTAPLNRDAVVAVSSVVSVGWFEMAIQDKDLYMAWLEAATKNIKTNTEGAHTINAVKDQITAAGFLDETLDYLDTVMVEVYEEMQAAYNADPENNPPPTGLWQRHVDYNAVWGLLKLATLYSRGNRELKYPVEAMRTCVSVILRDADVGTYYMNDVYNQWSAASTLLANARRYHPECVEEMYAIANENAVEMIENSIRKLEKFKQADGTFGYNQGTSAPYTQGVHVSLGLPEGDVNATCLAASMYRSVFTVLGYDVVPLCDPTDGERVLDVIRKSV